MVVGEGEGSRDGWWIMVMWRREMVEKLREGSVGGWKDG